MKLKSTMMLFTAGAALSANMAQAAINPEALAAAYQAQGYTFVEIKVGPTQTKLEAVKGDRKVEVVYDNATEAVLDQDFERAGSYTGRSGVEIATSTRDFEDDLTDDEDDESNDDELNDDESNDDEGDDSSDESDDGDDSDESDDSSDESDDDSGDDEGDNDNSDESDESDDGNDGDED